MKSKLVAAALAVALPQPLLAQTQQIMPPVARYWMSVETAGGMGMDLPPGMGALMAPGMQGGKRMRLDLGSTRQAAGDPRAAHAIPPGLSMGTSLPLLTPQAGRTTARESDQEPEYERPKGRMLIYWGCGESVRPGQPVVIGFAKLSAQDAARAFQTRSIARPRGPSPGRSRTYGSWPNQEDAKAVPAAGSLRGEHIISGNYSPEIRFSVGEPYDFMDPVAFEPIRTTPGGAYIVRWKSLPTAIGYFATAMGQGDNQTDVVTWSSSETQEMGQLLMDYIPPTEVERLIREKVVLPPQTTECRVPAGVFRSEASMFSFIAYGNELNLVHPPRPKDPKQVWEQEWAVKLRLKSTAMTVLSEGEGGGRGRPSAAEPPAAPAPQQDTAPAQTGQPQAPDPAQAVEEGVKVLRGILRF